MTSLTDLFNDTTTTTTSDSSSNYTTSSNTKNDYKNKYKKLSDEEFPLEPIIYIAVTLDKTTPADIVQRMATLAGTLSKTFTVRTCYTGQQDVDSEFLQGLNHKHEVIIPWKGFEAQPELSSIKKVNASFTAKRLAAYLSTGWFKLKPSIQAFIARDVHILVGTNIASPAIAYIYYTPDGCESLSDITDKSTYYRTKLKICQLYNIPTINVANSDAMERLKVLLSNYELNTGHN